MLGWQAELSQGVLFLKCVMDEAVCQGLYCFTLRHRFGQGSKVYVHRHPKEIAIAVRKYLRTMIRDHVRTAATSILKCVTERCACSVLGFPDLENHRYAKVVYAETSYE